MQAGNVQRVSIFHCTGLLWDESNKHWLAFMRPFSGRTPYAIALTVLVLAIALQVTRSNPAFLDPLRNLVFDTYQLLKPRQTGDAPVVIVDIDERSLQEKGQWPWPRSEIAAMTQRLNEAGALAIAFDIVFAEPDRTSPALVAERLPENLSSLRQQLAGLPDHDAMFAQAIAEAPVVLGFFDSPGTTGIPAEPKAGIAWLGGDLSQRLYTQTGTQASMAMFQSPASGAGTISLGDAQTDDIIRDVPMFTLADGRVFPSLAIEALRVAISNATGQRQSFTIKTSLSGTEGSGGVEALTAARTGNFEFPLTATGDLKIYYTPQPRSQFLPAADVFDMQADSLAEKVGGRIVLVGVSAVGLRDIRTTALRERVPGVAVHAQIISQIMAGEFLSRPDWAPGMEWVMTALFALSMLVLLPLMGPLSSALVGGGAALLVVIASWIAFSRHGLLLDPLVPMTMGLLSYMLMTTLLFLFTEREKRFIRNAFQHYLAPGMVAQLEKSPDALKLGGEIRPMTMMFMDVRGFTPISERLDPQELVSFLNDLLSPLSEIIQHHEGAIDKYIGDSIMAFWNAPLNVDEHPRKACLAALEMLTKVEEMNAADAFGFKSRGLPPVTIGIGISTGDGCVGNLGSATRFDYSVVGDTVNIAARLESASKDAGWPILVSGETRALAGDLAFLDAGSLPLKGKSKPIPVHALVGNADHARTGEFKELSLACSNLAQAGSNGRKRQAARRTCLDLAPRELRTFIERLS